MEAKLASMTTTSYEESKSITTIERRDKQSILLRDKEGKHRKIYMIN